jgi:hypothetical protein
MNLQLTISTKLKVPILSFVTLPLLGVLLILMAVGVPAAFASPESELASDDIAQLEVILYKIFRSPDGYAALIGGSLNSDTPLPTQFEVAVPAGVELLWFGEISGGPRENDRIFPEPYTVRTENGFDIYTAITYEHVIQIEYLIEEEPFENLGGGDHLFNISYTPLHDARILRLAAYLPMGSVVRDPAFVHLGDAPQTEEPLYGITLDNVSGGQNYEVQLRYGPPAAIARQGSADLAGGALAAIAAVAVALGGSSLVFVIAKRRKAKAEIYEGADEDYEGIEEE